MDEGSKAPDAAGDEQPVRPKMNWLALGLWTLAVIVVLNIIAAILVKMFMFPG